MRNYPQKGFSLNRHVRRRTRRLAWKMRGRMTAGEKALWKALRNSSLGVEFFPQVVIRGWVADFWCPEKGIVVEVDGASHRTKEGKAHDEFRDFIMSMMDIIVLRFTNTEVQEELDRVLGVIGRVLEV